MTQPIFFFQNTHANCDRVREFLPGKDDLQLVRGQTQLRCDDLLHVLDVHVRFQVHRERASGVGFDVDAQLVRELLPAEAEYRQHVVQ